MIATDMVQAWRDGIRRVNHAPAILAGLWLLAALLAWPIAMSSRIDGSMILASDTAPGTFAGQWVRELKRQTIDRSAELGTGLLETAREPLAFVDYASRWMVSLTASYPFLALWMLVSGGLIDRYARDRPTGAHGVIGVSGAFFFRFLRLALLAAVVHALAFRAVGAWPVGHAAILALFKVVLDYAQVRAVVEDRRSMVGALVAAFRFLRRHWIAAIGLCVLDWLMVAAVAALYVLVGPGAGSRFGPDTPVVLTIVTLIAVNQLYVAARLWTGCVFWSSATSLFQAKLAHAGYAARPRPVWPDSPSAEAIRNLEFKR